MLELLQNMLGFLFSPLVLVIVFCIQRKIKWVAVLFSLESITYGSVLSLICIYAVPVYDPKNISAGTIFYLSSSFIACFLLRLISRDSKLSGVSIKPDSPKKWLFLALGISTSIIGFGGGIALIYMTKTPMPYFAAIFFMILALISSYLFNYAANIASPHRPNLTRWIVALFVGFLLPVTGLVLALILIYALPTKVSEPYAAAIAYLGTVTYTCLIINVASNYVSTRPYAIEERGGKGGP